MANLTTSADIDTFMDSADNSAARANLGAAGLGANTFTGQQILSTAGAASTPPMMLTGAFFTGGSATTTKPQFLIEPTGTTSTGWSTSGTGFGVNAPNGFTGNLLDLQVNGVSKLKMTSDTGLTLGAGNYAALYSLVAGSAYVSFADLAGFVSIHDASSRIAAIGTGGMRLAASTAYSWSSDADPRTTPDTFLRRGGAAACVQMGTDAAGVTNQHFKACNRITSDGVGANLTISGGNGRGGAGGSLIFSTYDTQGANTQGNLQTRLALSTTGILAFSEAVDMSFGGTTGTKLGTTTSDKLAFWNKTPIVQPSPSITAATFTQNTSGIADDSATYGGYTIGQIAAALIDVGILA